MNRDVTDLYQWACARIRQCRRDEHAFGAAHPAIEAATERRALQTVLRMLDLREPPREPLLPWVRQMSVEVRGAPKR